VAVESSQNSPVPTGSPPEPPVPKSLPIPSVPAPKPVRGELPDNTTKRPRLKIPEPLRGELLQRRPQASPPQGAPIPYKTSKREKLEVPEPLRREPLQLKPQASLQGTLPDNLSKRPRLKIPKPLRQASSVFSSESTGSGSALWGSEGGRYGPKDPKRCACSFGDLTGITWGSVLMTVMSMRPSQGWWDWHWHRDALWIGPSAGPPPDLDTARIRLTSVNLGINRKTNIIRLTG